MLVPALRWVPVLVTRNIDGVLLRVLSVFNPAISCPSALCTRLPVCTVVLPWAAILPVLFIAPWLTMSTSAWLYRLPLLSRLPLSRFRAPILLMLPRLSSWAWLLMVARALLWMFWSLLMLLALMVRSPWEMISLLTPRLLSVPLLWRFSAPLLLILPCWLLMSPSALIRLSVLAMISPVWLLISPRLVKVNWLLVVSLPTNWIWPPWLSILPVSMMSCLFCEAMRPSILFSCCCTSIRLSWALSVKMISPSWLLRVWAVSWMLPAWVLALLKSISCPLKVKILPVINCPSWPCSCSVALIFSAPDPECWITPLLLFRRSELMVRVWALLPR